MALALSSDSCWALGPDQRSLYERSVVLCGADPADVVEVRIGQALIEVDVVDFNDPRWPTMTLGRRL
jgi:hypothetical protein